MGAFVDSSETPHNKVNFLKKTFQQMAPHISPVSLIYILKLQIAVTQNPDNRPTAWYCVTLVSLKYDICYLCRWVLSSIHYHVILNHVKRKFHCTLNRLVDASYIILTSCLGVTLNVSLFLYKTNMPRKLGTLFLVNVTDFYHTHEQ